MVLLRQGDVTIGQEGPGHTALLLLSGLVTAVPLVLFGASPRRIPLSLLGLLQYLTPTLQLLCGVVVFGESVPAARWVGFVVVWGALALLLVDVVRRPDREGAPGPSPVPVSVDA